MMENSDFGANTEDNVHGEEGGAWSTQTRRKRNRRSTGGTFSESISKETLCSISKEAFKDMPTDDKLVSLFEIMISGFGSMNSRVNNIENNVHALISEKADRRIKLLEYKSIDQETRSQRNNLIFRGFSEVVGNDDCVSIIQNFLSNQLDMQDATIQRAHRLGTLRGTGMRPGYVGQRRKNRPIIVCFRDYKDVQDILAKAHTLQGTEFGINRDYPDEIVKARSRLWGDYKAEKPRYPRGKVYIGFPAKLVVAGEVVRDEFPDWQGVLKGSRDERNAMNDSAKSFPLGRGRGRAPGRARGWENSSQRPGSSNSRRDRSRGPDASRGSANEEPMFSDKSDSDTENNQPSQPYRATSQLAKSRGGASGSANSTDGVIDDYSDAMRRLESTVNDRMGQHPGSGTYRSTLTVKTPTKNIPEPNSGGQH